jgi:hypothetical protein
LNPSHPGAHSETGPATCRGGIYAALERSGSLQRTRAGFIPPLHINPLIALPFRPRLHIAAAGGVETIRMKSVSPDTDFSFDFHHLDLRRVVED